MAWRGVVSTLQSWRLQGDLETRLAVAIGFLALMSMPRAISKAYNSASVRRVVEKR